MSLELAGKKAAHGAKGVLAIESPNLGISVADRGHRRWHPAGKAEHQRATDNRQRRKRVAAQFSLYRADQRTGSGNDVAITAGGSSFCRPPAPSSDHAADNQKQTAVAIVSVTPYL
jgi:hypothetical protein